MNPQLVEVSQRQAETLLRGYLRSFARVLDEVNESFDWRSPGQVQTDLRDLAAQMYEVASKNTEQIAKQIREEAEHDALEQRVEMLKRGNGRGGRR